MLRGIETVTDPISGTKTRMPMMITNSQPRKLCCKSHAWTIMLHINMVHYTCRLCIQETLPLEPLVHQLVPKYSLWSQNYSRYKHISYYLPISLATITTHQLYMFLIISIGISPSVCMSLMWTEEEIQRFGSPLTCMFQQG
jgi:hypothetical protein